MKVSIIVPCYNVVGKVERCLNSLRALDFDRSELEVIFVDDASSDATVEVLTAAAATEVNWRVERLQANSGSASAPRNRGVALSRGDYVFFLDSDDEIRPDALTIHYQRAVETGASIVRGYLIVDDGKERKVLNRIDNWPAGGSKNERIAAIIGRQSTTNSSLIDATLLRKRGITWPEDVRMGEDTLFLIAVLCAADSIEYVDAPGIVYVKRPAFAQSVTRSYGRRELLDHLRVWRAADVMLAPLGLSYTALRLKAGLSAAVRSMIFVNRGDIDEQAFASLSDFVRENWNAISGFGYNKRHSEVIGAARHADFDRFTALCRPRLVIAGHDFKFIEPAARLLSKHFDIRYDKWRGHDLHDEKQSRELLDWAELIWCEWMLGNAVWYSRNKGTGQRLVVRMHAMELQRDFGARLEIAAVDAVVSVSVYYFEKLIERFPDIPREKVRLIPNYADVPQYVSDFHADRLHTLAMIGIVGPGKGLLKAIDVLTMLRAADPRYTLKIFGKRPEDYEWLRRRPDDMAYYDRVEGVVRERGLTDAVIYCGHADMRTEMAAERVGFVLSVSEHESFHIAVLDGFAGGGVSLALPWAGVEYIYPREIIVDSVDDMVLRIRDLGDKSPFLEASRSGRDFTADRYSIGGFVAAARELFGELA